MEAGPLPWRAFEEDGAAHQLDQPVNDGEAKPGAAIPAGGGVLGLGKGVENGRLLVGRDADAGVADRDGYLPMMRPCLVRRAMQVDADLALLGEFEGSGNDVVEDLLDAQRVTEQLIGNVAIGL